MIIRMKMRVIYEWRVFSSGDSINNVFIIVQVINCCYKVIIVDFNCLEENLRKKIVQFN